MQFLMHENPAHDLALGTIAAELNRLESEHERSDDFAGFGREDRHRQDFFDRLSAAVAVAKNVTNLLLRRSSRQGKLPFFLGPQLSDLRAVRRSDDRAVPVQETI